ncbi:MAG: hypothetical protein NXI00_16150 [Cytophagales bacterium]|nr:hypothetical protein [Cytophagales bacterium]
MDYSIELQKEIREKYGDFKPLINALESGSPILGRYLCDSIPSLKRPPSEFIHGKELEEFIIKQVMEIWEREDIYRNWLKEVKGEQ